MAKLLEYDVTGVEESGGGTGVKCPPGLKVAKIMIAEVREKKADGTPANDIRLALAVGEEYDWLFTYIGLGPESDWKLAEFIRSLGLKDKGKVNLEKVVKDGTLIRVKVNAGEYQGEYSPQAGKLYPADPEDEYGSSASELSQSTNGAAAATEDEPEASTYTEGFEASRESDPEVGSYDDWEDADLEAEVSDRGLTIPGGRGAKRDKYITALRTEDAEMEGGGADPEEPAVSSGDGDDYDSWELDQLKTEYESRNFDDPMPAFRGSGAVDRIKAAIVEALREDDAANPFEA